jgi:hypothetical protein
MPGVARPAAWLGGGASSLCDQSISPLNSNQCATFPHTRSRSRNPQGDHPIHRSVGLPYLSSPEVQVCNDPDLIQFPCRRQAHRCLHMIRNLTGVDSDFTGNAIIYIACRKIHHFGFFIQHILLSLIVWSSIKLRYCHDGVASRRGVLADFVYSIFSANIRAKFSSPCHLIFFGRFS